MTSNRYPLASPSEAKTPQELEFDRWCIASELIRRLQEAGFDCELVDDFQNRH
jgi:hypothetical protein